MIKTLNQKYEEEYRSSIYVLKDIIAKEIKRTDKVSNYVQKVSAFIIEMAQLESEVSDSYFEKYDFDALLKLNHRYYQDITGEYYQHSYANPQYACEQFGLAVGQVLSSVYFESRQCVAFAFEHRTVSIYWQAKVFLELYNILDLNRMIIEEFSYNHDSSMSDDEMSISKDLIEIIRENAIYACDDKAMIDTYRKYAPSFDTYSKMIQDMDLEDERYIFRYGMYIGENEIELVRYFKGCSADKLERMADTFTEAFIRGYERNNVDITPKRSVNIGFHIGFERMVQIAVKNFKEYQLVPLVYYDTNGSNRPRIMNTKPSQQMEYDHRFDDELFLGEDWAQLRLDALEKSFEYFKEVIVTMAGPAIVEVFGETPFAPVSKAECIKYDDVTKEIKSKFLNEFQQIFSRYLPRSLYSFTMNSYPLPAIGVDFDAIFDETIEVNTLDEELYIEVQQKIIQTLDLGRRVHITGRNGNKTDLIIALNKLIDPEHQTNFNNCTSDVNVPVGEVFTTPRLEGTCGKLHVKEVYLHGLKYIDLEIDFEDGMMRSFTCKNFDSEEDNVNFVLENLTHPHKTLPLGEFAIGTNTKAYVMAKKYQIEHLIPILIGEKMGPHFAVGDTCYVWSEDVAVYNPDGREIIARDNSKSIQRKTNLDQAYTYCHTDITIPYSELDSIRVKTYEGEWIDIINEGRFVLKGTEMLNEPLKEMVI